MEKKNYQKPNMCVVKLENQSHMLAGSPHGQGGSESREVKSTSDWSDE